MTDLTVEEIKSYLRERIEFLAGTLEHAGPNAERRPKLEASQAQYASILRWIANAEHGTNGIHSDRTAATTG